MLNHKYTSRLARLIGVKRMLSKGIQVDLSDFNEVQRKWAEVIRKEPIRTCQQYTGSHLRSR